MPILQSVIRVYSTDFLLWFLLGSNLLLQCPSMPDDLPNKQVIWSIRNPLFGNMAHKTTAISTPPLLMLYDNDSLEFQCANKEPLIISAVSEMAMIECQLDSTSMPFLICNGNSADAEHRANRKRLMFRHQFSSASNGDDAAGNVDNSDDDVATVIYHQPKTIYFISTSNGSADGLWNSRGGLCASANLRFRLEFSDKVISSMPTTMPISIVNTENGLEYSIEELAAPTEEQKQNRVEKMGNNWSSYDRQNELAQVLRIKPEYLEFVRNHAINGGTGEIRFPPTEEEERNSRLKWPRFVSPDPQRRSSPENLPLLPTIWINKQDGEHAGDEKENHVSRKGPKASVSPWPVVFKPGEEEVEEQNPIRWSNNAQRQRPKRIAGNLLVCASSILFTLSTTFLLIYSSNISTHITSQQRLN